MAERSIANLLERADVTGALRALLDAYGEEIQSYVRSVVRDRQQADEVFAQVHIDLWRGLPGYRAESSTRTWAYVVAQHACVRLRARAANRRDWELSRARQSDLVYPTQSTRRRREARHALLDELRQQLPEQDRLLLLLRVDRGLSWEDVARVLAEGDANEGSPSVPALRKRFERIKERLRERLREHDEQ